MKVSQVVIRNSQQAAPELSTLSTINPHLVFVFGTVQLLRDSAFAIAEAFPAAHRVGVQPQEKFLSMAWKTILWS